MYGNTVIGTLAVVIFIFIGHTTGRKNRKERKHIAFTQSLKKQCYLVVLLLCTFVYCRLNYRNVRIQKITRLKAYNMLYLIFRTYMHYRTTELQSLQTIKSTKSWQTTECINEVQ